MTNAISKVFLCGLGLASLTKDAIQRAVEDLVKQSEIPEAEGKRLVKDLQRRSMEARVALEKKVDVVVHKLFENLDPAAVVNSLLKRAKPAKPAPKKAAKKSPRKGGTTKTSGRKA